MIVNRISILTLLFVMSLFIYGQEQKVKMAAKPLYRDAKYDGAADPVVIWNSKENKWFMFYTNRRANMKNPSGVDWVHGTPIGIAESSDGGATWTYRCNANINYGDNYTYWAPDVIEANGTYHMYLTVVPGVFTDWKHPREIVHLTSDNLIDWVFQSSLNLASDKVIDACVFKPEGADWWYMYYNNEKDRKSIYTARSKDLYNWEDTGKAVGDKSGEGPKVFYWKDHYFMIVDNWNGLGVYSSEDLKDWTRQSDNILQIPGRGLDDGTNGLHADVLVNDGKAYIFYFTHPDRTKDNGDTYASRRSSIQVAELEYKDGIIICDRDKPVYINLKK